MPHKSKPFDAAKYFPDAEAQLDLLNDALREGDAGYLAAAIGTIARARGIGDIAKETGLGRQALYRSLREEGNPTADTLMKVLGELGIQLEAKLRQPEPA